MNKEANINQFISKFRKTELAKPCNFDVTIYPSDTLISTITESSLAGKLLLNEILKNGRDYKLTCEASELPARSFGLVEHKTYGPMERTPATNVYDPITLTFMCSDDMSEKRFFDLWLEVISISNPVGLVAGTINDILSNVVDLGFGARFDFQYKDNYTCSIEITQYDQAGKASYKVLLMEAFPFSVNQMPLNWAITNSYHKINVTFFYKYFIINPI